MRAWLAGAGVTAVTIELGIGAVAVIHLGPTRIALYPIACAIASAAVAFALWRLLGHSSGGGGGNGRDSGGRDRPPPWWPQFERDLDEYVRERSRVPAARP